MIKTVNLWAGPGAGKSTTAAGLFFVMKTMGLKVELVTEYAKELTYRKAWHLLGNQQHVTREQTRRQRILQGQVDWIVTDSPIPLGLHYAKGTEHDTPELREFIEEQFFCFHENVNFFITRCKPYAPYGRRQSEASARAVDDSLRGIIADLGIDCIDVPGDKAAPAIIIHHLEKQGLL